MQQRARVGGRGTVTPTKDAPSRPPQATAALLMSGRIANQIVVLSRHCLRNPIPMPCFNNISADMNERRCT
jgi:hypothetical protein